jgi:hypothetical protein
VGCKNTDTSFPGTGIPESEYVKPVFLSQEKVQRFSFDIYGNSNGSIVNVIQSIASRFLERVEASQEASKDVGLPLNSNSQTLTDLDVVQAMEWACSGWLWPRKFGFETGLFVHVLETV